ncbi:MAG: AMP-binding protein [Chloroflexi bacterium]|nr:AMP-binding protein [Chloroflexota bacterium]
MADWFEKVTLGDLVDRAAGRFGDKEALCFEGRRWTFNQLQQDINRAARGLLQLGIQPGEKVILWMPNRPEWVHILFALAKIGAVLVPINTRFRTSDLEYVVRQSDGTTLITVDRSGPVDYLDMVRQVCPEIEYSDANDIHSETFPELKRVLILGESPYQGTTLWADVLRQAEANPKEDLKRRQQQVDPDGIASIMYTSGTSGFPKGVMQSHRIVRMVTDMGNRIGITEKDVLLIYLPLFHALGLWQGPLMSMLTGARMVLTTLFDPPETLELIEKERATRIFGFDTHYRDLMAHPDIETRDLSSLRACMLAAGMASSEPIAREAQKLIGPTITGWGMTECGIPLISFLDSTEDERCAGSGYPLPGFEFKVIDPETGETLPPLTTGELCVRGHGVMQGYYKKPDETAQAVNAQGWLHTGDAAVRDEDGNYRFLGRYKDMLKVGGENVDAAEVEAFLSGHPGIEQVQIIGVPDSRLSEVPCACVVPNQGHELSVADLDAYCRGKLASFKIPRYLMPVPEFPMTPSGKVQKFKLLEMALETLDLPAA